MKTHIRFNTSGLESPWKITPGGTGKRTPEKQIQEAEPIPYTFFVIWHVFSPERNTVNTGLNPERRDWVIN
jgi:hypothetical protein